MRKRTLAAIALSLLVACMQEPKGPERVEIPVSKQPGRAMNEEMVEGTFKPWTPSTKPAETAVAQTPVAGAEKPKQVAVAEPKPEPARIDVTPAPPPTAKEVKPTPPAEPAAKNYGVERARLVNQSDEIVSVLKNGATVIVKRMPSPVVAVRGYVQTGGVYEGQWLGGGLSHLLEHLVAGGSSKRRTEAQNRDLLQKIGNNSNAYTTDDHTAYYVNTTTEHLDEAVDLVTGWMLGALITPDEYKREYEVVQRELEKDKGEPDWVFYMLSQHNRYRVSPARVPVIGYQEVIQGLSRDDVYSYYLQTYQVNNMVFSITGDVDPETMLQAVQKQLDDAKPGRVPSRTIEAEPPVQAPRTIVATFPKLGQAKLELGFPSVSLQDPDLYALDLMSTILGGGESSLFVEELRDKRKLVTAVGVSNPTPSYVEGSFQIGVELAPDKIAEATKATMELLDGVVKDGLSDERIQRAKVQMRTARVRSLQTSENLAGSLATDFLNTGDPHFTDVYLQRIDKVTAEQLKQVAKYYFNRDRMLTTALIPAEYAGASGLPKAEDLLRPVAPTTKESAPAEKSVVTRVELPNGAILLHKRMSATPMVEVRVFSLGGLTEENAETNGIGNLAMEMAPRGTKTRNAQQIASFFDSIGGTLDTACGNNSWYWNTTCLKGDFEASMEVFSDVIKNPTFPDDELAQMKQRVAAAIEMQDADWHTQAMRFFKSKYFGPMDSPYQFLAIGTKENVPKFSRDQLDKWYRGKILKARRVVAVFGDVDLETAKKVAIDRFGGGENVNSQAPTPSAEPPQFERVAKPSVEVTRVEVQKTEQPLAGVIIGYDAASVVGDPANYPIAIADTMSSGYGYPTGYLHEILRGRGLVYVVHAQNIPGRESKLPGTFLVYAGCDPSKVNEVIDVILENIARLQGTEKDLQPGWFERSKELCTTSDALDTETPGEQAQTAAIDELMGLGFDYHDQFKSKIEAVKVNDVNNVAARRLVKCVVTVSTPAPEAVTIKPEKREYRKFPPVDLTPRGVQHDANK